MSIILFIIGCFIALIHHKPYFLFALVFSTFLLTLPLQFRESGNLRSKLCDYWIRFKNQFSWMIGHRQSEHGFIAESPITRPLHVPALGGNWRRSTPSIYG